MSKDYTEIVAIVTGAAGVTFIILGAITNYMDNKSKEAKIEREYVLQEMDLNDDGLPEKFYEIGGKKAFISIDGKSIEDYLNKK